MDVKSTRNYLYWLFCQFELITCSYLMEPWEKVLFYTFNLSLLLTLLYTTYIFVSVQLSSALHLLWHFPANQHSNPTTSVLK
ncbi:SPTSB palmitoyltransferase, partial [Neodrepanis coruscans]|nr:SPTSB palmitoyltransferase [Neodrepanis coruscans]